MRLRSAVKSALTSRIQKQNDLSRFSARDLGSLQRFLDSDFQNFWDIRRYGNHVGTEIKCALCPWRPPGQTKGEDFVWYSYRKYRALCNHIFTAHTREQALKYRRLAAGQKRLARRGKVIKFQR